MKAFHCKIIQDKKVLDDEKAAYLSLPKVRTVTQEIILQNYEQIKHDIQEIEQVVHDEVLSDPAKQRFIVKK